MPSTVQRLWRRLRYGEPVILVSGLPRSGTSMAMKMLEAGGLPVVADGVRSADEDNPKGYFEDERVKALGESPDKTWLRRARGRAIKIISYLLKDLPPDNNYKVIFLRRDLREVLASQSKMLERRNEATGVSDEQMIEIYQSHLWRVDYLFRHAGHFERLDLQYAEVVADPRRAAERIDAFLGGRLDVERMVEAVDPQLYRNRAERLAAAP
ncbi:MAG: sulfotransferase family protein [Thermoanaerobaculia bacterium]|nr:MAG: sulfotransferase family protein [Thermoanaerobaculia bacterium]